MATVDIDESTLTVHITGFDRVLAFKSSITVPLEHVDGVEPATDEARRVFHGLRLPGSNIPGIVTAGSYLWHAGWTFWDVHDPARAIVIRLHDEHYARLVVEADNPEETIERIRAALAASGQRRAL